MATAGAKTVGCNLVKDRTVKLEANRNRHYNGLVVSEDMLLVVDSRGCKLMLYRFSDGKLLAASSRLQSLPFDVCLVSGTQVVVTRDEGQIEILSVESTIKQSLTPTRRLNVTKGFDSCHGVKALRSGGILIVSGVKRDQDTGKMLICWGPVFLGNGNIGTIRTICKGFWSYLATSPDDSDVYISCNAGDSHDTGVYAFDIRRGSQKFVYRRSELKYPRGISVDTWGYIYVCNNLNPPCIHQLTNRGEPLTVHKERMPHQPWGVCWEEQREGLYVTSMDSEIWRFHLKWSNQQGDQKTSEVLMKDEGRKPVILETYTQIEQGIQKMDLTEEIYSRASDRTMLEEFKVSSQKRDLPPGKKYHVFFSYCSSDMHWVKETLERLEKDHGFVCCEYDRDNTPGTPLLDFVRDSIMNAYKTVLVMTWEAFRSRFVKLEINMAIIHGQDEDRTCLVPVLLEDCDVPLELRTIDYVDARDSKMREIWWPKLISVLETYGNTNVRYVCPI